MQKWIGKRDITLIKAVKTKEYRFERANWSKTKPIMVNQRRFVRVVGGSVPLSYATAYYGLASAPLIFETAVRALAEGNSIRATGRIMQIDKDTICDWLNRAALQCRLVMLYLWDQLHVTECQLDELWSFVHTKEDHLPFAKPMRRRMGMPGFG